MRNRRLATGIDGIKDRGPTMPLAAAFSRDVMA